MTCRAARLRFLPLLASALVVLAGCATTARDGPPIVAPQPRSMTTTEAVAAANHREHHARQRPSEASTGEVLARSAEAQAPLDARERLDELHDRAYARMQQFVEATDRRFARRGTTLLPVPAAPFRVGLGAEAIDHPDGTDLDLNLAFDLTLRLPNIERRLRIFVTSDELDEGPRDPNDRSTVRAGLRYELEKYLNFDIGVKGDLPPVAFMSLKWARQYALGRWDFYPFAKLFAETDESVGYAAAMTFDRWSGQRFFRTSSYVKWRDDRDRTEWSQSVVFARAHELIVPERYGSYLRATDIGRGHGLRLHAAGADLHGATYYEASWFYKRPTWNPWLYWSVEPLVRWDRRYDWHADPGIRLALDALFWDLARPGRRP
ncbi:MAG: hypothetical protein NAOJABEB_02335 [Steroidobacteraceae bacterium]|nr:hypothetical protein [Steroidobacteraceae bacterium]